MRERPTQTEAENLRQELLSNIDHLAEVMNRLTGTARRHADGVDVHEELVALAVVPTAAPFLAFASLTPSERESLVTAIGDQRLRKLIDSWPDVFEILRSPIDAATDEVLLNKINSWKQLGSDLWHGSSDQLRLDLRLFDNHRLLFFTRDTISSLIQLAVGILDASTKALKQTEEQRLQVETVDRRNFGRSADVLRDELSVEDLIALLRRLSSRSEPVGTREPEMPKSG